MEQQLDIDEGLLKCLGALLHQEPNRIRLNETFIRNGGDSLLAIRFSNLIKSSGYAHIGAGTILRAKCLGTLLDKTQLRDFASEESSQPSQIKDFSSNASNQSHNDHQTLDPIQRIPKSIPTTGLPLTFIQAAGAVFTHYVPGAAVQHVTQYCYTDMLPQLKSAFARAMSSYEVFRLKFDVETDPLLVKASLKKSFQLNWTEQQIESLEEAELEDLFSVWSVEASSEPVFRVATPRQTASKRRLSVVHWFFQFSLMDGVSIGILLRQVDAFLEQSMSALIVNDCTFDVAQGLKDYHATHEAAAKTFWAKHEVHGGARNHPLLRTLGDQTPSRSRTGFTFEVLVRAAMGLVLSKLQSTSTVSLMSVSSRRSLPVKDIEEAVGSFATSMILTIDINKDGTAHDLLKQVFHKVLELENMSYSDPSDGFSLGGLVVVSSTSPPHIPWYSGGQQTEVTSPKQMMPTLYVSPTGRVQFAFNNEWRSPPEMKVMTDLFQTALISLASGTLDVVDCVGNMLPICQRKNLLEWGNCFATETSLQGVHDDITSTFLKQVLKGGDDAALQVGSQKISYKSLAIMIQTVGQRLRELLEPGNVLLIHADGSVNWVIAIFAVLWADCVFSPQGVDLPHQLRSHHYSIADAQVFLLPHEDMRILTPDGCELRLCVEKILQDAADQRSSTNEPATRQPKPWSAAYICFSSGTTGQPKAIKCTHSGVVAVLRDPVARLHVEPGHRVAQTLAPPFDGALLEVFSALCYGGTLLLKDPMNPFGHLRLADSLLTTPSLAAELIPEDYPNLKYVYLASEVLPQHTADRWSAGQAITYNIYGPTECHMVATAQRVRPGQPVSIGKPFLSTRIYILDEQGALTPPLVAGEIHIAGVQVSRGYIGLEEETKHRFIPDTIWPSDSGTMYKTGDWGYWTTDGEIAFMGRTDRQIKLCGYRIDLNDIQARLQGAISPNTRVAVVVVGDTLGCAVSGGHDLSEDQIRETAEKILPPQSVPKVIRLVETMPVSPFGKTNYRAVAKLLE